MYIQWVWSKPNSGVGGNFPDNQAAKVHLTQSKGAGVLRNGGAVYRAFVPTLAGIFFYTFTLEHFIILKYDTKQGDV